MDGLNSIDAVTLDGSENLFTLLNDMITLYCTDLDLDIKNIHPSNWMDLLGVMQRSVIQNNKVLLLKNDRNLNNAYNQDKVYNIYNIYKMLCNRYRQEISVTGFLEFTGINHCNLYNHEIASTGDAFGPRKGDPDGLTLAEKINKDNEASLTALMIGDKGISTKYLSKLNHYHGWSLPGVTREDTRRRSVRLDALPPLELSENSKQLTVQDAPDQLPEL